MFGSSRDEVVQHCGNVLLHPGLAHGLAAFDFPLPISDTAHTTDDSNVAFI